MDVDYACKKLTYVFVAALAHALPATWCAWQCAQRRRLSVATGIVGQGTGNRESILRLPAARCQGCTAHVRNF